jgi:signal transduction histidine kinase/ActR/RegA family two-component response regulator
MSAEAQQAWNERLTLLRDQTLRTPLVLLVIDIITAGLMWHDQTPWPAATVWVLISLLVQLGRQREVKHQLAAAALRTTPPHRRPLIAWFFMVGLSRIWPVWSAFGLGQGNTYIVSVILMGQAAGGIGSVAGLLPLYLAWALPTGGALAIGWLSQGGFDSAWLALLLALAFLMLTLNVKAFGHTLDQLRLEVTRANHERERAVLAQAEANAQRHRAENAVAAKTRFFAAASHDLRQPLGVLRWYGDAVSVYAQRLEHEALTGIGEGIARAVERAEPLVRRYLEIARLEAGAQPLHPKALAVKDWMQSLQMAYQPEAQECGLALSCTVAREASELAIWADEEALRSIVDNLVSNALKFTPQGGVTVSAKVVGPPGKQRVRLMVSDTGVGIPAHALDQVFEDFFQLGNAERASNKGLGLGLSIVRRQALLMGLTPGIHSQPGQGTSVWLDLPAMAAPPQDLPSPTPDLATRTQAMAGLTVLLIDDEPEVRRALGKLLQAMGWQTHEAADLDEAWQQLQGHDAINALIVDYRLAGEQTGPWVLQQLRDQGWRQPAVLLTGDTAPERLQELASLQLPVLHKPVDGPSLVAAVMQAVQEGQGT